MRTLLFLSGILLLSMSLLAQQRTVTGKVTDGKGSPIIGATIITKGGPSTGTSTKEDGTFSVTVTASTKTLSISGIGWEKQDINITGRSELTITLLPEDKSLQEVLVVGYGVKTVRENTGSISKVSGARVAAEPVSSFDQALAGKTAGVQISNGAGILADRTAIRVRGINSISLSSQPLVVVDGIPQNGVANLNSFNTGNSTRFDPLALINPNDIESIEVLKDAGAAVIYGSRASNGVILITTKKGRKGSVKVSIDSKIGWAHAAKLPPLLNGDDFTTITNEKRANATNILVPYAPIALNSDINGDGKPDRTNWNDYAYRTGRTTDNSISFSGGADKLSVYGSARYLSTEGITLGNKLTSGQARMNMDFTPKTWFKAGVQLSYSKTLNKGVLSDGFISGTTISGWQAEPNVSPFDPTNPTGYNMTANGLLGNGNNLTAVGGVNYLPGASYYVNILPQIKLQRNDNTAEDLRANIYGELQPIPGLRITTKFGTQNINNFEDQYNSPLVNGLGFSYAGLEQEQQGKFTEWVWQNYASYDKTIAHDHKIGVVAGSEYQKNNFFQQYTGANNFTDPFFTHVINGAYTNTLPGTTTLLDNTGGTQNAYGLISYFGRLNYSYAGKYFVEGAFRRDGFSGFGAANQFGNFPSISAGWEVTKEKFIQGVTWLDYLKVRGSYGQVGNAPIQANPVNGNFLPLNLYAGGAYTSLNGLAVTQAGNPNLKWETAKKTNIGFEATVLKGKLSVTADYFNNKIDGLILSAPVLYIVGIPGSSISKNIGSMNNKGIELTINSTPYATKDFTWTTSINFTRIWNKVTNLVGSNADILISTSVASVGRPLGTFFMPNWAGVDPATGNPRWYAKDGSIKQYNYGATGPQVWTDGKGAAVTALGGADAAYQKKGGLPTYYGGWNNTFTYKGIDLGIDIVYQGGNYVYNSSKAGMLTNQFSNNFTDILRRWTTAGQITDVPKVWLGSDNTSNQISSRWLEKGDFIRVRTITLGYSLPKKYLTKIGFENIRAFVQAYNPFIITKYTGLDPDVSTSGTVQATTNTVNSNITLGIDNRASPTPKTITIGVNVTF